MGRAVSFQNVGTGRSATRTLEIVNSGKGTLNGIVDTSGLMAPFSAPSAAGLSFNLAHNRSQPVAIKFAPGSPQTTSKQSFAGTLRILTGDIKLPAVTVSVQGFGITGKLVTPKALSFRKVKDGGQKTLTLTIKNQGLGVLHVSIGTPSLPEFSLPSATTMFALDDGQSQAVKVQFAPDAKQTFAGAIAIASDDPSNPTATVKLTGTGK